MAKRNFGYKNSNSKSGEITVRITPENAERLKNYGKTVNRNAFSIVNGWVAERLDVEESAIYEQLSKEELIKLLLERKH